VKAGKVYLVGAGPGHPELLTLKAAELLKEADVVVYDRLIQDEVLALAKPAAERVYMGQPPGRHLSRQDEIHELLVRKAGEGKTVVRLKGGDPFLFGRGGEEVEYLAEHGVPFEVIPGVSSALAAPLGAGIPVTYRETASCVAIVTGQEAGSESSRLSWEALSGIDTLVFLMGVHNVDTISRKLMEHGRSPGTPAAMIQMAFWHDERVVVGTLGTISDEVVKAGIKPPATLVVGEVVRLRATLAGAQRDLQRRADGSSRFEPSPAPDQLMRLATAGLASRLFGYALDIRLFDQLEECCVPERLAQELGLNPDACVEVLETLAALGLIESTPDGYRNLELASRYLRSDSPQSLRPALLFQVAQSSGWEGLARYASEGCRDFTAGPAGTAHQEACEAMARFAAPAVVERLDLGERGPVLLVGWGGKAYREAIAVRWPQLVCAVCNPLARCGNIQEWCDAIPSGEEPYGAILLSGLMSSCARGQMQKMLHAAARRLRADGIMVLHDAFLPESASPAPEVLLDGLGQRVLRGGCRAWSTGRLRDALCALGLSETHAEPLPGATVLVTARRG